ncbi:hypothetical protein N7536_004538 [Penicillium majusculum]|nr:hypothetical protein N7536_004538 [Penicillium majusculum]
MVPLLHPLQSRLFADRTHDRILYPIEKRCHPPELNGVNLGNMDRRVSKRICTTQDLPVRSVRLPIFPRFPDYYSSLSHHTATSFPAQRPLGNDLKALSIFILWSPLTSNAELQPSPIYQPPRPPAALTL